MIGIAPFEPAMSAAVVALWNRCIGAPYPMTERLFRQQVLDDPFAQPGGNLVALDGRRVAGWLLCRRLGAVPPSLAGYSGRASIGALCVDPDYRRRGIGSRLYEQGERFLTAQGAAAISVVHYPGHLTPGIPFEAPELKAFFDRRGFQPWTEASDLRRQRDDGLIDSHAEVEWRAPGMQATLRPAREGEQAAITAFLGREFPGGWEYEAARDFDAGGEPADTLIAAGTGKVFGFCRTYTPESLHLGGSTHWFPLLGNRWGGLGPIGVAAAHRGRGLGLALLRYGISSLKRREVDDMVIDWTVLERFYARAGFGVWKRYWLGSKPFGNERIRSAPA